MTDTTDASNHPPGGHTCLLVDLPELEDHDLARSADGSAASRQTSAIAAARTVLLEFATPRDAQRAVETLAGFSPLRLVSPPRAKSRST